MKPPPFAYRDPETIEEALEALAQHADEGKILAGGQSLIPLLNMRLAQPAVLIDINRIPDLQYVRDNTIDGRPGISFGAVTRQSVAHAAAERIPLLREGLGWVGHPQIRNRGTIGGSVAHADPSAELPLLFLALDGMAAVQSSSGTRAIPAASFFAYTFTPDIEPDEMLTEVWVPIPGPRTGQAFLEVARRHGDFALVAAGVSLTLDESNRITHASIALGGAAPTPMRAKQAEEALNGQEPDIATFAEIGHIAAGETDPTGDIHADAEYRREVAGTLVTRALTIAAGRIERAA
jgi:CO/xanthine dehydrogenase FAD-binding subunit